MLLVNGCSWLGSAPHVFLVWDPNVGHALLRAGEKSKRLVETNTGFLKHLLGHGTCHLPSCATGQGESHGGHISGVGKDGPPTEVAASPMATRRDVSPSFRKGERGVEDKNRIYHRTRLLFHQHKFTSVVPSPRLESPDIMKRAVGAERLRVSCRG